MYDKIESTGEVLYQDVLNHSDFEKEYYEKGKKEGYTEEDGFSNPNKKYKVEYVSLGTENYDFYEKEF